MLYFTYLESCLANSLQILEILKIFSLIFSLENVFTVEMQARTLVV